MILGDRTYRRIFGDLRGEHGENGQCTFGAPGSAHRRWQSAVPYGRSRETWAVECSRETDHVLRIRQLKKEIHRKGIFSTHFIRIVMRNQLDRTLREEFRGILPDIPVTGLQIVPQVEDDVLRSWNLKRSVELDMKSDRVSPKLGLNTAQACSLPLNAILFHRNRFRRKSIRYGTKTLRHLLHLSLTSVGV